MRWLTLRGPRLGNQIAPEAEVFELRSSFLRLASRLIVELRGQIPTAPSWTDDKLIISFPSCRPQPKTLRDMDEINKSVRLP